jgi:6-phospho-beta-glucosidase
VLAAVAASSRELAVRAMASHPLVGSMPIAERLIDAYRARLPELAYLR